MKGHFVKTSHEDLKKSMQFIENVTPRKCGEPGFLDMTVIPLMQNWFCHSFFRYRVITAYNSGAVAGKLITALAHLPDFAL